MNQSEARDGELHRFSPIDVVVPKRYGSVNNKRLNQIELSEFINATVQISKLTKSHIHILQTLRRIR